MSAPLLEFTSHSQGKNAKVRVYPTHLELDKPRNRSKAATLLTMGVNYAVPRKHDVETLPIKAVQSVNVHGRFGNSIVTINTAAGVIEAKVAAAEADRIKHTLLGLMTV